MLSSLTAQSAYFEKLKNLQEGNLGAASPSTGASSSTTTVTTSSGLTQPRSDEPISCPVASGSENDDVRINFLKTMKQLLKKFNTRISFIFYLHIYCKKKKKCQIDK